MARLDQFGLCFRKLQKGRLIQSLQSGRFFQSGLSILLIRYFRLGPSALYDRSPLLPPWDQSAL